MYNAKLLFAMSQVEDKVKATVAKALSDKLQTEVDKNSITEAIEGIDVGAIVQGIIKRTGVKLENITSSSETIAENTYQNTILLANLDLHNATSIGNSAIQNCISLISLDLTNTKTIDSTSLQNCISLVNLNLHNATSIGNAALRNCISLVSLDLHNAISIGNAAMYNCVSLIDLELPNVTRIGATAFYNCFSLKTLKLTASQVATLDNTNAFLNTSIYKSKGYIYVPDNLVEDYKTATNWSLYARIIRPMSECEE